MKKSVFYIFVLVSMVFASCSKSLQAINSSKSKTILIVGDVKVETIDGVKYASFKSANGTKYHVDLSKYDYKVAEEASLDAPKSNLSLK